MYPGLNFTYGVEPLILYQSLLTSAIIKWWFSTSKGLRKMTTWYCYKMKIGFYHEVTWRGNSTTTKWRLVFIIKLLEGDTPPLQNEDWFLYAFIIRLLEGNTSILQNEDWFLSSSYLKGTLHHYKWRLVFICFYHQVTWREHFRRATSLATKWDWVFTCCLPMGKFSCYKMTFDF